MRAILLGLALFASLPAAAAVPTESQARDVEHLFGFDAMLGVVVQRTVTDIDAPSFTAAQKSCVASAVGASVEQRLLKSLAVSFVDGDTVEAWKTFGATAGGRRMLGLMQRSVMAVATEAAPPDMATELAAFTAQERSDVEAFMQTPAASVMEKGFGANLKPSDAEAGAMHAQIIAACGIQTR
jgi:hypothetical protein